MLCVSVLQFIVGLSLLIIYEMYKVCQSVQGCRQFVYMLSKADLVTRKLSTY